jgi:glycosyltransferase involved in cell wall biosynthesis
LPAPSSTHLVLIPSYNTGSRLVNTARAAINAWAPVWVVIDGSADNSEEQVQELAKDHPDLRILRVNPNRGKGGAVLFGAQAAEKMGYTHILTMDADGQHPATEIERFMKASLDDPGALVLGVPQFGKEAPKLRVHGRKVSNFWAHLETLWGGVGDSLFGLRVYPIKHLRAVMEWHPFARRFDFDPEVAVRLCWRRLRMKNLPCPVRYFSAAEGGVSQFRYLRDNTLLTWMHFRLMLGFLWRLPYLILLRLGILKKRP